MHSESAHLSPVLPGANDRSIGAILVDTGRLSPENAERILKKQREEGLRFGEAGLRLGVITEEDIQFALFRQFDYPCLSRHESKINDEVVAAFVPFSRQVEALRALRSQLMLRWFADDVGHKTLAVVSPGRGEGRSWLSANLAVVFSQLGEKTLLIDADMRNPRQHRLFGLDNRLGLSAVLSGRGAPGCVQRVAELRDLSVLPAGAQPPNPQELLARPVFSTLLKQMATEFDIILIDTPAGVQFADGQAVTARTKGALLVARKNMSAIGILRSYSDMLRQVGATVVGSVLNEY